VLGALMDWIRTQNPVTVAGWTLKEYLKNEGII
jgi:hypothetical protein